MTKHRFLILLLIFTLALPHAVWAAGTEARSISVFRVDGDDVKMSKGSPKMFAAREGYQLNDGYTVSTGINSFCYLQMDDNSILKMDQSSKVAVSKKSADKLSVSVQSGGALMDAGPQDGEQVIETRVGNTGLTIRAEITVIITIKTASMTSASNIPARTKAS